MERHESVDIKARVTESVVDVFETMLSLPVVVDEEDSAERTAAGRVVGAVNFAGEVMGLITFDVSDSFSRLMAAAMLGIEVDEIESGDEIKDLLGEISNIIGGNLKSAFTDAGLECSISTPSITAGSDFTIESLNMKHFQRFAFRYEDHRIFVEVGLKFQEGVQGADRGEAGGVDQPGVSRDFEAIGRMDLKASVAESLAEVFDTMLSMKIESLEEEPPAAKAESRLVGSVNFTGEIMGLISIGVSDAFSRQMTASMLGIEVDEIESDDEIKDLLGEISNIVGGNLKSSFTDAGIVCRLSPPAITVGTHFRIESLNMETYDRLIFGFQNHRGIVEVGVKGLQALKEAAAAPAEADTSPAADGDAAPSSEEIQPPAGQAAAPEAPPTVAAQSSAAAPDSPAQAPRTPTTPPPPRTEKPETPRPALSPESQSARLPETASVLQTGGNLDVILDIPLEISVELGRTRMKLSDLLEMNQGSVVQLAKLDGEPVDILANDKVIARGEVIVEKEKYGIRITEVLSRLDRIKSLR
jgi:flagellar motor switch protein FliN